MSIAALTSSVLFLLAALPDGGALTPAPGQFQVQVSDPLLAPAARPAREVKTWDEARALVRQSSTDERVAEAGIERAQGRWRQSLSALMPSARLTLAAQADALNPTVAPPTGLSPAVAGVYTATTPLGTAALVMNQPVLDLGAWKGLSAAGATENGARFNLDDVRRRVTSGLARALVAVVAAERIADLNRVGLRQALERTALIQRTEQLGAATQLDVVRVRQDVEVARSAVISGDEQLRRTREALGLALGFAEEVGVPADFALDGLTAEATRVCPPLGGELGWKRRGDLEALRSNVASTEESRRQAAFGYLPTLGLTGTLFGYTTNQVPARFGSWNLIAVLTVPLWEGGLREGLTQERDGLQVQAAQSVDLAQRQVQLEVGQAQRGVGVARALTSVSEAARDQAAQLDALTRRSFEVGRGSSLELVQSAGVLRQADVALATRQFELVQARLDLLMVGAKCEW